MGKDDFFDSLDKMVGANPKNARKSVPVTTWFQSTFGTTASASVVNAANQSYNRVNEQFAHRSPHVIFVVTDPAAVKGLVTTARKKWYSGLESVLILEAQAGGGYGSAILLKASDTAVTKFWYDEVQPIETEEMEVAPAPTGAVQAVAGLKPIDWASAFSAAPTHLVGLKQSYVTALAALVSGKHVVLYGPPGTGKTDLAASVCNHLGVVPYLSTATSDWTTFETLGGYFPVLESEDASGSTMDFSPGLVIRAIEKGSWLIIDELNRADVDKAFGELFTLLAGGNVRLPHRKNDGGTYKEIQLVHEGDDADDAAFNVVVPSEWRMIGTMNTFDKASLYQLSYAFMRRFAFIEVGVPSRDDYSSLIIERSKDCFSGMDPLVHDAVSRAYTQLFADVGGASLEAAGLRVGPSIALDCIAMCKTLLSNSVFSPDEAGIRQSMLEAICALLLPQFEGREREHSALLESICACLEVEAAGREIVNLRLAAWTGALV